MMFTLASIWPTAGYVLGIYFCCLALWAWLVDKRKD